MPRKKKKSNNYFTKDTELAIIKYNETEDPVEKNKIYEAEIHHALFKLTQNLIHTFKFYYTDVERIEDLKHELVSILLEDKIMKKTLQKH